MELKSLPIGVSTFESLITSNALYVDKTEFLYQLIKDKTPKRYFISRPRRFGKSLTCSTLATIFEGDKKKFKGLWIEKSDYQWKKVPVIHLDFNGIRHKTAEDLEDQLTQKLYVIASEVGVKMPKNFIAEQALSHMVIELGKAHGQVAVIIDEYDKPIIDHIDNLDEAKKIQRVFKSFYGTFKNNEVDANLKFLFVTGVSKFSKVSLFSEVNNLKDITMTEAFDAIVGYTQKEVEYYFKGHIEAFAKKQGIDYKQMLAELKRWYNGFRFTTTETKVYNPFSLHNSLVDLKFSNYWFTSGTSSMLINVLAKSSGEIKSLVEEAVFTLAGADLDAFSPDVYFAKIKILLLQTGYLTFKNYNPISNNYILEYPNHEVRSSVTEQILDYVAHLPTYDFGNFVERFHYALLADDIDLFCQHMSDFFKLIPHNLVVDREKFYHATFYNVSLIIGAEVVSEVATNQGFIDIVLQGKKKTYVIEFKKDRSPDAALKQISDKKYFEQFKIKGKKPVVLVGMNFKKFRNTIKISWKTAVCKFKK